MNEELKQKWVTALRSGRYEQGQRLLRTVDDRYCCLGVLVDVADPEGWEPYGKWHWLYKESDTSIDVESVGVLNGALTIEVMDTLMTMNDTGDSFSEIATWIEENL